MKEEDIKRAGKRTAFPIKNFGDDDGMSKRFYAACAAMQGIIASESTTNTYKTISHIIERAYLCADELLKQENDEE